MQHLRTGKRAAVVVPAPQLGAQELWIETRRTLISAGTERMLVSFGQANLLDKARQQPERVKQVLNKMKTEGVATTLAKVKDKLDSEIPLGYCQMGIIRAVGSAVQGFAVGDRVISNAPHADVAAVPQHLCAKVPENVTDDHASFTVLAAIALHGTRLLQPTLGEYFVVTGLGLVGLLAVQLLRAQGCRVLALDMNDARLQLAKEYGAEIYNVNHGEPTAIAQKFSRGIGVDGVLVCTATDSDAPIAQAAEMCRQRGRIILTGVSGLHLSRDLFYKKELSFQVSCSYGPGRYDHAYEQRGQDYPIAYVRWTEQRNFQAVLDAMASGAVNPSALISHHFAYADIETAYQLLTDRTPSLGIVIEYPEGLALPARTITTRTHSATSEVRIGVIGAGNFATGMLIPAFQKAGAQILSVCSKTGVSAAMTARKWHIPTATSDLSQILQNPDINTVIIATPHHTHAALVAQALAAGKHVFVEKPLAISQEQLQHVHDAYQAAPHLQLMVGFNRRFAPHIIPLKKALDGLNLPKFMTMTVNAGALPQDHWTRDPHVGGGRIIGEGCHFVDLLAHLAGSEINGYHLTPLGGLDGADGRDGACITLNFADGSVGVVQYIPTGHAAMPKERLEIHVGGRSILLDNFRMLHTHGINVKAPKNLSRMDKGHHACAAAFVQAIRTGKPAMDAQDIFNIHEWML